MQVQANYVALGERTEAAVRQESTARAAAERERETACVAVQEAVRVRRPLGPASRP